MFGGVAFEWKAGEEGRVVVAFASIYFEKELQH